MDLRHFIAKLNSVGSALVYSTYLGGSGALDYFGGDVGYYIDRDFGSGIAVDGLGSAYITGATNSTDFPTMKPLQPVYGGIASDPYSKGHQDAFVAKINPAGSALIYSTYLGGNYYDVAYGVALDGLGNAYITGNTWSSDFPTANPWQGALGGYNDTFVAKLNRTGSALIYSTYLTVGGCDYGYTCSAGTSIALDRWGSAYVGGYTYTGTYTYGTDAFLTKFDTQGGLDYASTLLTYGLAGRVSVAVDNIGNAYVGGASGNTYNSNLFPALRLLQVGPGGGDVDVFVTKIVGN